jgi:hypothetical protein
MKRYTLRTALLSLALAASHQTALSYRITYNSGPDDAKSNINLFVFTDAKDYAKLVKEEKATNTAQKILNVMMTAQGYIVEDCAPEFAPEDYVLDEIGDIIIGWVFGFVKRIEQEIATIQDHRQQKVGDVMSWTPPQDKLDPQGWVYAVFIVAKNDEKGKGQVIANLRIKPHAEFGINVKYTPSTTRKNGKGGIYKLTFEPAKPTDDADDAAYILNKDSLLRFHGLELGTSTQASNIEASLCDWSMEANAAAKKAYAGFTRLYYDTTAKEYQVMSYSTTSSPGVTSTLTFVCYPMKTFITKNFEDAWPAWQKGLSQAITVQSKAPPLNKNINSTFNNLTTEQMRAQVSIIGTYGGGQETPNTLQTARKAVLEKNNNQTKICQ